LLLTAGSAEKPTLGKVLLHRRPLLLFIDTSQPARALQPLLAGDPCSHTGIMMLQMMADVGLPCAQVIAVGSGRVDEKTQEIVKPNVEKGSTVLYSKYSGTEFSEDDKKYIVVRETDVIATLG